MVLILYLVHYDTLLQNVTAIFLQNSTKVYYKMYQVSLLQNATVLWQYTTIVTKCIDFITKCDSFYKLRRLLQNGSVQSSISKDSQKIDS